MLMIRLYVFIQVFIISFLSNQTWFLYWVGADGVNVAFQVVPSYIFFSSFDLKLDAALSHCSTLWYKLVLPGNTPGLTLTSFR